MDIFRWLVCHDCGKEFEMSGRKPTCDGCGAPIHVRSNADGELPKKLPRHSSGCSNQNVLDPAGAYRGAVECGCQELSS